MGSGRLTYGWTRVAFGDVAMCVNDRIDNPFDAGVERYVGLEHLDSDSLVIRRWGSPAAVTATKLLFRKGDIIFGRRRVYQRKLAVADFDAICSAHALVLRAKSGAVLHQFLPFFMQSDVFMERAKAISVGSLSPTINWRTLANEEFTLPPLDEQRRIATLLVSVDACCESLRNTVDDLQAVEYAFLLQAFGEYRSCPRDATLVQLSDVAEVRTGLAKGRTADPATTTRPYLRVANVEDGHLNLREVKQIVVRKSDVDRYTLRRGDVLMTEGGDLDKLGRGTVWQDEVPGCLHQNHVFAVRTDASRLDPWYLAAIARSHYGRSFFLHHAKRTSNLASVNKGEVSSFGLPLRPLSVQRAWLSHYRLFTITALAMRRRRAILLKMKGVLLRDLTPLDGATRTAQRWSRDSRAEAASE